MSDKKGFSVNQWLEIVGKSTTDLLAFLTTNGQMAYDSTLGKFVGRTNSVNDPLLQEARAATLTNKTINADSNTITNIENADIKAGAAIDAAKLADGSISNTEFQYLNGVTSNIQTQLDNAATDGDLAAHIADTTTHGTTGDIVGTSDTQVLTNKTIDGDSNTVQDLPLTSIKTVIGDASKFLARDASGIPVSVNTVPAGTVVGTTDTQVLTNKDINVGTASNTNRLTIGKNTKTNLDGLTRKEATLVYGTDSKQLYIDDGSNLLAVGGSWTTYNTESISAGGTVSSSTTVGLQFRRVQGDATSISLSATPFGTGANWPDGTIIRLVGQSNANTVTATNNDAANGMILNGSWIGGYGDQLTVQYDSSAERWFEVERNN